MHIHSRYSRATSKSLTIRKVAAWAAVKGIDVVGTGDFTHPGWMEEIENTLYEGEDGLLHLKDVSSLGREVEIPFEFSKGRLPNFILSAEISSIYKKHGKVRKIHNLVIMPSLDAVKKFNEKLMRVGNLSSDGRPILGLDCEDLLEMVLETHENAFLIPAHIWTPWFSLFGSRSGFDSIEECFGSLAKEIFALETGLSSDPPMNWLWSELDRFYLISNSDAHSGEKLGREANLFKGEISYENIYTSLKHRTGNFLGTIEFFPEEGKYHLDGHRKCGVVLEPKEALQLNNICPVCGEPLTIGVMHRILTLSDRELPEKPEGSPDFYSLIPLTEILSELTGKGPKTKIVYSLYSSLVHEFQSEINILMNVPPQELKKFSPMLSEAIHRMREGKVYKEPGFDGKYGRISIFSSKERKDKIDLTITKKKYFPLKRRDLTGQKDNSLDFNKEQLEAIKTENTPCLVIAGPGTGKTRTILGRIMYLIKEVGVHPYNIAVLTFTTSAAGELVERISFYLDKIPKISTLHGLGYEILKKECGTSPLILSEVQARKLFLGDISDRSLWDEYLFEREQMLDISAKKLHQEYIEKKKEMNVFDMLDMVEFLLIYLKQKETLINQGFQKRLFFEHVLVDEIQDLSPLQVEVIKLLCGEKGKGFFGIGDPNQAIYSFRGGCEDIIFTLREKFPHLEILSLEKNYRSKKEIVEISAPLIQFGNKTSAATKKRGKIYLYEALSGEGEAMWIAKEIKKLVGSTSHMEEDRVGDKDYISPSEIAVLVRFKALLNPIKKALDRAGIPCALPEEVSFYYDPNVEKLLEIISSEIQGRENPIKDIPLDDLRAVEKRLLELNLFDMLFFESENYKKLISLLKRLGGWREVLNYISISKDFDTIEKKAQKVHLTTIHASKGLEFEAVFLPALEENIIPFNRSYFSKNEDSRDKISLKEEQRLLFVGMTRAKSMLFLSYAKKRRIFNQEFSFNPSPFLKKLPLEMAIKIKPVVKRRKKVKEFSILGDL